jgi:hypothetical protein
MVSTPGYIHGFSSGWNHIQQRLGKTAGLAWLQTSPMEVYSQAARYSIDTEYSREIMWYKEGAAVIPDLPTWVPELI